MQALARLARPLLGRPLFSHRTYMTLAPLRPSLTPLRRAGAGAGLAPAAGADVVAAEAVSAHPALGGALQLRFGPRNTMNGHTRLVQKRRHGFLHRMRSKTGRRILQRRRLKGRRNVAC